MGLDAYLYSAHNVIVAQTDRSDPESPLPANGLHTSIQTATFNYMVKNHAMGCLGAVCKLETMTFLGFQDIVNDPEHPFFRMVRTTVLDLAKEMGLFYEFSYHRKDYDLQDLMHALFVRKGGSPDDFNMAEMLVNELDIIELEKDLFRFPLQSTQEFCRKLSHVQRMKQALENNHTLFYWSWY